MERTVHLQLRVFDDSNRALGGESCIPHLSIGWGVLCDGGSLARLLRASANWHLSSCSSYYSSSLPQAEVSMGLNGE